MSYTYQYPHFAITADSAVFLQKKSTSKILLIKRKNAPFENHWALPGGYLNIEELLIDAAHRELREETGLNGIPLEFICIADAVNRDPRERTITGLFGCVVSEEPVGLKPSDDAIDICWARLAELPALAFDHQTIIQTAQNHFDL